MAADMHIHVLEGITEEDIAVLQSSCIGSKYFRPDGVDHDRWEAAYDRVANSPNIWVGEVSWLKAALSGDFETYVPTTIEKIRALIGEDLPIIDDKLIADIMAAFNEENTTGYALTDAESVRKFLEAHKGKRVFTISW